MGKYFQLASCGSSASQYVILLKAEDLEKKSILRRVYLGSPLSRRMTVGGGRKMTPGAEGGELRHKHIIDPTNLFAF